MERGRGILSSFLNARRGESERKSSFFLENGSKLKEEFIAEWNGRCRIPIRTFSAKELLLATNNFHFNHLVDQDAFYRIYKASLENRPILVKKYGRDFLPGPDGTKLIAVRDIAIASQMSTHKNVLKLIGCCLEFQHPALVYEYPETNRFLSHCLYGREGSFPWKTRLRIANDVASALVYLHTAFSTPIIHRNLKPEQVVVDQFGVAKLSDFGFCISIPLGESQVADAVVGTCEYLEPQYVITGVLTEKTDVYNFGLFLVVLFTGRRISDVVREWNFGSPTDVLKDYLEKDEVVGIVDARMLGEGGAEQEKQLKDFAALALRCLQHERDERPEMLDVAKELGRIQRSIYCSTSAQ